LFIHHLRAALLFGALVLTMYEPNNLVVLARGGSRQTFTSLEVLIALCWAGFWVLS